MKPGANNERVYRMTFASVYPHYVNKLERKGRTKEELHTVIHWLTGYTEKGLAKVIADRTDFEAFFAKAPYAPERGHDARLPYRRIEIGRTAGALP
jgi:hypothetical protein